MTTLEFIFDGYNLWFLIAIGVLTVLDFTTGLRLFGAGKYHKNFAGVVVAVGIIGTFFGIVVGLKDFDTTNIQDSIPGLLDGLKTAFVTSIAGLLAATLIEFIRVWAPLKYAKSDDPVHEALLNIDQAFREFSKTSLENQNSMVREFVNYKNEDIDSNKLIVETIEKQSSESRENLYENLKDMSDLLSKSFQDLNTLLEQALEEISSGASEEIIKALEGVITDFNDNLKEQFGENFHALNEACKKLVDWQEEYRESMIENEKNINAARESIEKSITAIENSDQVITKSSEHMEQLNEMGDKWDATLTQIQGTTETINTQLTGEEKLLSTIDTVLTSAQENSSQVLNNLNDSQIKLDDLVKNTQGSFDAHAEQIKGLAEESGKMTVATQEQLGDALENLENSLVSLTNQFTDNYQQFLDQIRILMDQNSNQ